jgi:CheY-like chemotaxis protein
MIASHDLPPAAQRAVARANEATIRAARITSRLLAFARRQPLMRQTLDLNRTLADLSDMLRRTLGPGIDLHLDLSDNVGLVDTDIDQFETAILNLVLNARDAMPAGGQLRIESESVAFLDPPRSAEEVPPGRYARISVSDNGAGMSPEVRARAVEPFFTTKHAGGGTGLGLSMVYGFLKQLGGHARIYSEEGLGTRVSLFFPLSGSSVSPDSAETEDVAPRGTGELVLVVEDDADVRLVTVSRLEDLGYRTVVAMDSRSALKAVESHPDIRLGVLDVVIPGGMDGHALADAISGLRPDIRIILMSGYSPRMAAGESGVSSRPFLTKPVSRLHLARTLRAELDRT